MKIEIQNYRRVRRFKTELAPGRIALVAGRNESGKTSVAQAIRAALTQTPIVVPGVRVKDAVKLVLDGEKAATVQIGDGTQDGTVTIGWPACKVYNGDGNVPRVSGFSAGLVAIPTLAKDELIKALITYIKALPSDDVTKKEIMDLGYDEVQADKVVARINEAGWDTIWGNAKDNGTKLRGAWEQITGETFGDKKADGWVPNGPCEDVPDEAISLAEENVRREIGVSAVSFDEVKRLQSLVDEAEGIDPEGLSEMLVKTATEIQGYLDERAAIGEVGEGCACPACGVRLISKPKHSEPGSFMLLRAQDSLSPPQLKNARMAAAVLDGKIENAKTRVANLKESIAETEKKIESARTAQIRLSEIGDGMSLSGIEAAESALSDLRLKKSNWVKKTDAAAKFDLWRRNQSLVAKLAPDGIRRTALTKALSSFNGTLDALCQTAGWPTVFLDADYIVNQENRPYPLISEGAKFRANVILQAAFASCEGAPAIVIDGADILDAKSRNGLFALLSSLPLASVVTMTYGKKEKVPDIAAAGLGTVHYLVDGEET